MSIASNFPAIKPTLLLDFANTEELDSRITFTRASTATYYGTQTAKAEENLLLQSQDFTTTWTVGGQNATITANTTSAPDGTTTADALTDDATSSIHRVSQTVTTSSTSQMVYSVFAKYSTMQWISISAATGTGTWAGAKFDVQNGVLGSTSQQGTGFTANSSSITSVGNGWYRCVLVYTPGASGSTTMLVSGATDGTTFTTSQRGSEVYIGSGSAVFLWGAQLEQRSAVSSYTVTTTQTITNYIPQLLTAASGVARFDHNPTTFESLGLLIEESRTNLVTYSEQFDNAAWSKSNSTITANTIVSPDGTLTGDKLVEDTSATTTHFVSRNSTVTFTAAAYTFSVYLKAAERTWARLTMIDSATTFGAYFNLSTGAIGVSTAGVTATATSVGNGWYRCSITATTAATASGSARILLANADNGQTYTGDGYSGIYTWGAQLEVGAFATSYIPTVASTVTRAADAASMTGTNFSSWFNQAQGSLYVEATPSHTAAQYVAIIGDGVTTTLGIGFFIDVNLLQARVRGSGASSTIGGGVSITANTAFKTMLSYAAYNNAWAYNGANRSTGNTNIKPENSATLQIGSAPIGGTNLTGTIKKLSFYPVKLTDAQMNALTS